MPATYVLIDFENVQPSQLASLDVDEVRVAVFLGARQGRVDADTVTAIQRMGNRAEYVRVTTPGRNSLDFHLAFHLGQLAAKDPGGKFFVISKDTDYDPLITHMRSLGLACQRCSSVSGVDLPKKVQTPKGSQATQAKGKTQAGKAPQAPKPKKAAAPPKPSKKQQVERVLENLRSRASSKPATVKALSGTIKALFPNQLSDKEVEAIIHGLQSRALLKVKESKVTYSM